MLGSQGDAGQFRTPRHIIDFIVEVVAPKKGETVLDPACGTAGFLISAYKHILHANTDAKGNSTLTPDERGRLAANFKGYDISPDMVRLSLVNFYLHGFADPHIDEYDTLTSEDRWNEFADVIFANPPFMSPKGGIKPHRRFSIQAKRSEVLFVDYIAEHLTPSGRAGIIVPEGIIFQSQAAYKALRKMLVEDALVAVVSPRRNEACGAVWRAMNAVVQPRRRKAGISSNSALLSWPLPRGGARTCSRSTESVASAFTFEASAAARRSATAGASMLSTTE